MKFARVEMLFLIWMVPVLALVYFYGWRKRRRILNGYARQRTLAHIVPHGLTRRRRVVAILILTAMVCSVIAMSGPQYGFHWQEIERQGIDIIIALDCSRSMLAGDIQPTRLDRAKREIYDLLNMLQGDRVGLVAFSGTAFLQCPLTIDYPAFYLFLDVLTPDYLPVGGSDLTAALQIAQEAFDTGSDADKAVILITDGEHTGESDPMTAAQTAQRSGIKLFTIGVGSGDGVPVPEAKGGFKKDAAGQIVLSRLDESLLTRIALATGGSYVRSVAGDLDLETIYSKEIRGRLQSAAVDSGRRKIWADRYQWPLVLAVTALLLARWIPLPSRTAALVLVCVSIFISHASVEAGPVHKGYDAYQGGDYDMALKQFIEGQLQDPENPSLLYNIGNTFYKMENYDAATEHFRQALSKASPDLQPRLLYNMGNSAYRRGQLKEAIRNYEAALKLAPDDIQIKENLDFVKKQLQQQQQNRPTGRNEKPGEETASSSDQGDHEQDQERGEQSRAANDNSERNKRPSSSGGSSAPGNHRPTVPDPAEEDQQGDHRQEEDRIRNVDEHRQAAQNATAKMLNRLKDQPGRALMSEYRKHPVEKDW